MGCGFGSWGLGLRLSGSGFGVSGVGFRVPTRGPSWGHPRFVVGAIGSFLEPFRGYLSSKMTNFNELTSEYTLEGPCMNRGGGGALDAGPSFRGPWRGQSQKDLHGGVEEF